MTKKWIVIRRRGKKKFTYGINAETREEAVKGTKAKKGTLVSAKEFKPKPSE